MGFGPLAGVPRPAFWRSWAAPGSSWAPVGCLLGASWLLLAVSRLVSGAPWPHVGVQKRLGPRFWKLLRRARLGFARLLANVLNLCLLQLLGCERALLGHLAPPVPIPVQSSGYGPYFCMTLFSAAPRTSLHNVFIDAVTALLHLLALCFLPIWCGGLCAAHGIGLCLDPGLGPIV